MVRQKSVVQILVQSRNLNKKEAPIPGASFECRFIFS